jgi:hypothetical protein
MENAHLLRFARRINSRPFSVSSSQRSRIIPFGGEKALGLGCETTHLSTVQKQLPVYLRFTFPQC